MIHARYLKDGKECSGTFKERSRLEGLQLLAPVKPGKIIAVGLNYLDHIKEFGNRDVPENPTLFVKLSHTVIGPGDAILLPKGYQRVDYEAELAVVMGKHCFDIGPEEAREHILGYTCANDVTERVVQKKDGQWIRGKNYPTFCPVGPWIDTDFDWSDAPIRTYLNGKIVQDSNLKEFIWNPWQLVSFISRSMPLDKGDVIITGTPSGVGPMDDGDEVTVEIGSLGRLTNTVGKA
ncbi:MAG: fumarylacetoacetate hydrolase family protein [Clostridia bacterium]